MNEHRKNYRVDVDCEMAIQIKDEFLSCRLVNLSEDGALAEVLVGDFSVLNSDLSATCFFEFDGESFEGTVRIVRVEGRQVGLVFWALDTQEVFFLKKLLGALSCRVDDTGRPS